MRMFPALINCCTIDWLQPWPEEALYSVAEMFLENLDYEGINKELVSGLAKMCVFVHTNVN
jgi:dynein heavy chain, axonemal